MNIPFGRDQRRAEFSNLFAKSFRVRVVMSPAFMSLTASAKSVCFIVFVKADNAKYHKRRLPDGRPVIRFSASESKALLNISGPTHTAAIRQLIEHGFIDQVDHGGLLGANGIASTFAPSKRWERWVQEKPAHAGHQNIKKALEAKRAQKQVPKPLNLALQVVNRPELQPGAEIYYYAGGTRARKGTLIEPIENGWRIQGRREAGKFHAPIFLVTFDHILTPEQLHEKRRANNNSLKHRNRT